jgi:NitT/TauT family transport system permease protein/taurine transport system permease protein
MTPRIGSVARGLVPFAVLLGAWAAVSRAGLVPAIFLPAPGEVARVGWEMAKDASLWVNIGASLERMLVGVVVSVPLAVAAGVLVGLNRRLAVVLEPMTGFFNSLSGIAWLPLAITWFGLGWASVTFILFNTIFFLVFFNTLAGVRAVPRILEQAVRTLGGSRRHVIAAEMIATTTGLGFLIFNAGHFHQTDAILVGIITIGLLWLATDRLLLQPLERWTIERWGLVTS